MLKHWIQPVPKPAASCPLIHGIKHPQSWQVEEAERMCTYFGILGGWGWTQQNNSPGLVNEDLSLTQKEPGDVAAAAFLSLGLWKMLCQSCQGGGTHTVTN